MLAVALGTAQEGFSVGSSILRIQRIALCQKQQCVPGSLREKAFGGNWMLQWLNTPTPFRPLEPNACSTSPSGEHKPG